MANRDKEEKSVGKIPYAMLAARPPNSMATLMTLFLRDLLTISDNIK